MKSLLLDPRSWDLTVDVSNNIAVASDPYSLAQDAACAIIVDIAQESGGRFVGGNFVAGRFQ